MEQEQTQVVTTRDAGIRYGLIGGFIGIFYFLAVHLSGYQMQGVPSYISYLITGAIIFFGHKYYKENGTGFMSYGQGIGISAWIGIVSAVLNAVFIFVYTKFVDSTFFEKAKDAAVAEMEKRGNSEAEIEMGMKFVDMMMTPGAMFMIALIGGIIGTIIIGLLVTIFTQKKDPNTVI